MSEQLLILDLDETLVHTTDQRLDRAADMTIADHHIYFRPHAREFLRTLIGRWQIGIWSAGTADYVSRIVSGLVEESTALAFIWSRSRCTRSRDLETDEEFWVKDLRKIRKHGYSLAKVVVIDNDHRGMHRSYGNHLPVTPFRGDIQDAELLRLMPYLDWLRTVPDFRSIDRRRWRNHRPFPSRSEYPSS